MTTLRQFAAPIVNAIAAGALSLALIAQTVTPSPSAPVAAPAVAEMVA